MGKPRNELCTRDLLPLVSQIISVKAARGMSYSLQIILADRGR